jgi:magnesium-transporting ATPase (P-type)
MTTTTASPAPLTRVPARSTLNHIAAVVRLHFANPRSTIVVPWAILGAIFVMTLAVLAIVRANLAESDRADLSEGFNYSGSSFYIFVYMMIVAIQAISVTFQFALGFGVTRRNYYLGTAATFVILAAGYAVAFTVIAFIEQATNGWGFGANMFTAAYFGDGPWWQRSLVFFVGLLYFFFTGAVFAAVWVRWKGLGVTIAIGLVAVLLVGAFALIALTSSGPVVTGWLGTNGIFGSVMWSLVPTSVSGILAYLLLLRATPTN